MSNKYLNLNQDDCITKYFKDIKNTKILSKNEEIELAIKIKNGDKLATETLVSSNLKFVIAIAKEYQGNGVSLSDLINEGNYGLIKAASKFDHTKGFRFISYAVWWIRQSIIQSLNDNSRTIRLPSNVFNKINNDKKELDRIKLSGLYDFDDNNKLNKIEIPSCKSFNVEINEDGSELQDILYFEEEDNFYDINDTIKIELNRALSILTEREREIIELYYGLNDDIEPATLEGIGDRFGLSKERVRQIKERAIRKLRFNSEDLYDILNN